MNKIILFAVILIVLFGLFTWSPWISKSYAENRVVSTFEEIQKEIIDGCGFNCSGCGVKESHKALFGYYVTIEYACGLLPWDSPEFHQVSEIFVSFLGTVHGL
ncbi:hypothetical protein AMJ49_05530 [Parcubacteria bacterium DG_74_2]|nr:MAG: hypothetical protein AMJ49_05530 [Parcubacteria bacterium DG_74_2]